ncbi:MAG: glycosyl transferase family 1 [Bacteroidetes bacterium]|jgi:glycosyltransferase involved in cell wall biosynthesis|nr:glycosyl transferase family 1 [Bacteroidota bacterium]
MKIFIVGPAFPLRGGLVQFDEYLCRSLNEQGHQAEIISYSLQYPNFLFPGSTQYDTDGTAPTDIKIHTKINTVNPFNWFAVARFIKKQKPDLVIFRFWLPFFGPSLGTIARLIRKKTTVFALTDNVIPHEKRIGDVVFTKYFIKACKGFIIMSNKVLADLEKFTDSSNKVCTPHPMFATYGDKVSIHEAREKLGLKQEDKVVLFFGLIRKYKGLDFLLEAMADERIRKAGIKLLVAGEYYEDPKTYTDIITDKKLEDSVIMHTHYIPNEDVRYYFCASNLVAQTYRNATNSGVTMVSYFYEKPVLVTNVGGLSEIVPDRKVGYLVEKDIKQIADAILDYFENDREPAFTEGVKEEKKKYEWKTFIDNMIGLYQNLK